MPFKKYISFSFALVGLVFSSAVVAAPTYTGSLTTADGGLIGSGGWVSDPDYDVTFGWTITQNADLSWHYRYVFDGTGIPGDISHLVIETSSTFTANDVFNDTPGVHEGKPDFYGIGNGNPNIPATVFGIKFESSDVPVLTVEFDSPRMPVWGDIYAKGGNANSGQLWNAGFLIPDPIAAPAGGSLNYHVLVPDTRTSTIPAPGAFVLAGLGATGVTYLRRRRKL